MSLLANQLGKRCGFCACRMLTISCPPLPASRLAWATPLPAMCARLASGDLRMCQCRSSTGELQVGASCALSGVAIAIAPAETRNARPSMSRNLCNFKSELRPYCAAITRREPGFRKIVMLHRSEMTNAQFGNAFFASLFADSDSENTSCAKSS
jgi:hypothetical protein